MLPRGETLAEAGGQGQDALVPQGSRRIAVLGGSFDPPHVAHVLAALYVLLTGDVEEVLVVPVFEHAFGKRLAAFEDRVRLCELAFAGIPCVSISRVEATLPLPNRTLLTLERLQAERPDARFRLVVGSDVLGDAHKWHAFDRVTELAPLLVVPRAGFGDRVLLPEVSSTEVRELLARRDAGALRDLARLVPKAVLDDALSRGLYAADVSSP